MNFNKCVRCGCFFASEDSVCPNCRSKDQIDKLALKNYLANNDIPENIESLASNAGVSVKNVNRYIESKEFSDLKNTFNSVNSSNKNIITSL